MSTETPSAAEGGMLTFKVKTASTETAHELNLPDSTTVLELKNTLGSKEYEDVPADRQRLIYSGRVLKDDQPLSAYKIKSGNTIHMVKSAAPPAASASTPATSAVPRNIAAGSANDPLAGLTGARYAGQISLPNRSMFGADGGMGAPPNEDQMADMLSNPNTAQMMNEALNDPQMIDLMISTNPTLRALGPQAREILQSPFFRSMMTNPDLLRQAASLSRRAAAGGGFAAPGGVPTAPGSESAGAESGGGAAESPFTGGLSPFAGGPSPFGSAGGMPPISPEAMQSMMQMMGTGSGGNPLGSLAPFLNLGGQTPVAPGATPGDPTSPQNTATNPGQAGSTAAPGSGTGADANPFAALFGNSAPGAGGPASPFNPFAAGGLPQPTPEQMQQAMAMLSQLGGGGAGLEGAQLPPFLGLGGAGGVPAPAAPTDTRPPEEQYAEQLRQLNDMGFFDFEENVRALRRAGGSVQGAINALLG